MEHLPSLQGGMETVLKQTLGVAAVFYLRVCNSKTDRFQDWLRMDFQQIDLQICLFEQTIKMNC